MATQDDTHGRYRRRATLSAREEQVLGMASLGFTNAEIAGRLDVTVHAIKFHLASIYRKLDVANRTEAAVFYRTGGRFFAGESRDIT